MCLLLSFQIFSLQKAHIQALSLELPMGSSNWKEDSATKGLRAVTQQYCCKPGVSHLALEVTPFQQFAMRVVYTRSTAVEQFLGDLGFYRLN